MGQRVESLIGYAPSSEDLLHPADRRRFCYYAAIRNLQFEIADPSKSYDLVVVSAGADVSLWKNYEQGKVIYDQTDSYLAISPADIKGVFRGFAKFISGQNRRLLLNYTAGLEEMCCRADAVICTTVEQREDILPFCNNVHTILDFHSAFYQARKTTYECNEIFHLVWEGLPFTLHFLREIRPILRTIQKSRPIALHVITALDSGRFLGGKIGKLRAQEVVGDLLDRVYLYSWNEHLCSLVIANCDLAVIPVPLHDPFYAGKPENKLLVFWRIGVPTVTSATPAYLRAMESCGLSMACSTDEQWLSTLEHYMNSATARREAGEKGQRFVEQRHSDELILKQWDVALTSVLPSAVLQCAMVS